MITQIGIVAGEIWNFLDEHDKVKLTQITQALDKPEQLILMSLGWLARENHIIVTKRKNQYLVNLKKKAKELSK
jgi:hypothetical protein